ncbi:DNA-binding protein [bacterium D16-76]|nr:DNA-binding protein [bacterium D16-76]
MKNEPINWDKIPEVISADTLYKICHISKSTARYLLQSGKIPCEYTGKQTRCYKIHKQDVIDYLENRKVFPESYSAPRGWYSGRYTIKMQAQVPAVVLDELRKYYTQLLAKYPDVIRASEVAKLTGYGRTAVNNWCHKGRLLSFKNKGINHVPKQYLIEFFCSTYFRSIVRKSRWHVQTLKEFARRNQFCRSSKSGGAI